MNLWTSHVSWGLHKFSNPYSRQKPDRIGDGQTLIYPREVFKQETKNHILWSSVTGGHEEGSLSNPTTHPFKAFASALRHEDLLISNLHN